MKKSIWRVDIQKGVTHISESLHGGTKTFPFRHLEIQIVDFQVENKNISEWKKKSFAPPLMEPISQQYLFFQRFDASYFPETVLSCLHC